ncbi:MAG: peptidase S8, partial [Bdellovibrio sp. CG_4_9_14_3_um_filter_39_7]
DTIDHIGQQYGVLVIAAAGNDSTDIDRRQTWPASYESDNLMVVASTSSSGGLSGFSNYGSKSVDIAAPGSSIYSSTPGNRYGSMSGTSMACPTTVGVAAEVLANNPALTPVELKKLLMDTVTPIGRFSGRLASAGRVDLLRALTGK